MPKKQPPLSKNLMILILLAIIFVIGATLFTLVNLNKAESEMNQPQPDNGVACTMEAKLCPDGSAVGRQGPNCEFAECPSETPAKPE